MTLSERRTLILLTLDQRQSFPLGTRALRGMSLFLLVPDFFQPLRKFGGKFLFALIDRGQRFFIAQPRAHVFRFHACPSGDGINLARWARSEEHTSELQSLMRISYAVFCLKKKTIAQSQNIMHALI